MILAAVDMDQAVAAARALEQAEVNSSIARALETALVICYMRPFTTSELSVGGEYKPQEGDEAKAHAEMARLRDKVYAHTDKAGQRITSVELQGDVLTWRENWIPFPRSDLPFAIELCERLAAQFRNDAGELELVLEGRQ